MPRNPTKSELLKAAMEMLDSMEAEATRAVQKDRAFLDALSSDQPTEQLHPLEAAQQRIHAKLTASGLPEKVWDQPTDTGTYQATFVPRRKSSPAKPTDE